MIITISIVIVQNLKNVIPNALHAKMVIQEINALHVVQAIIFMKVKIKNV